MEDLIRVIGLCNSTFPLECARGRAGTARWTAQTAARRATRRAIGGVRYSRVGTCARVCNLMTTLFRPCLVSQQPTIVTQRWKKRSRTVRRVTIVALWNTSTTFAMASTGSLMEVQPSRVGTAYTQDTPDSSSSNKYGHTPLIAPRSAARRQL